MIDLDEIAMVDFQKKLITLKCGKDIEVDIGQYEYNYLNRYFKEQGGV